MYETKIKNISENKLEANNNGSCKKVSITFETVENGKLKTETITLVGSGSIKTPTLV